MKPFISKTISIGSSIYLLIPQEEAITQGIKPDTFYSANLDELIPRSEKHNDNK